MKLIPTDEFMAWAQTRGIGLDARWQPPEELTYPACTEEWSRWAYPASASELACFLEKALAILPQWKSCLVWKRVPGWGPADGSTNEAEPQIWYCLGFWTMAKCGIPDGFVGAVEFPYEERLSLYALMLGQAVSAVTVWGDIQVIPDNGAAIVTVSHHQEILVHFPSRRGLEEFTRLMAEAGHSQG